MLTQAEQATLAAVLDRLIPSDELGPGALESGVQRYVEVSLAGPYASAVPVYSAGLSALDADAAVQRTGASFAGLATAEQDELLRAFAASNDAVRRSFFDLVRQHAIEGMFGDPAHGGNVGHAGWRLIGFPGVKVVLTEEEQALGTVVLPAWEADGA